MVQQCYDLPAEEAHPAGFVQGDGDTDCLLWNPERHAGLQPRYFRYFLDGDIALRTVVASSFCSNSSDRLNPRF